MHRDGSFMVTHVSASKREGPFSHPSFYGGGVAPPKPRQRPRRRRKATSRGHRAARFRRRWGRYRQEYW